MVSQIGIVQLLIITSKTSMYYVIYTITVFSVQHFNILLLLSITHTVFAKHYSIWYRLEIMFIFRFDR